MKRIGLLVFGMALGLGASWLWRMADVKEAVATQAHKVTDDDAAPRAPVSTSTGPAHLHLDPAARALAAIDSQAVKTTSVSVEQHTPGRVLDGGELLAAWRARRAARSALHAQQDLLASQRTRLEKLRGYAARGEIAVTRELNALEVSVRREADIAVTRAAQEAQSDAAVRARWGASLAASDGLEAMLATGAAQLVEFAAAVAPPEIFVASDEQRDKAGTARVLGAAPTALGTTSAATWIALVEDASLRAGMRVSVWVPQHAEVVSGALLPASALVWYAGVQWFFVEIAPGEFERRRLPAAVTHGLGVIVADGLESGTPVVVRGAQTLLAEQLRQRIPAEDDD